MMARTSHPRLFAASRVALLAAPALCWCTRAGAEESDAARLFREGRALVVEGRFADACPKLEESQRAAIEIPLGVDSRQRYAQEQGRDWHQIETDNEEYQDAHGADGPPLPLPGAGEEPPGVKPPTPGAPPPREQPE